MVALPHIIAGALGILTGFVALSVAKGATVHRKSGLTFVIAMMVLSVTGVVMAVAFRPNLGNVMAGVLTFYLVLTAMLTVRRPVDGRRWLDRGAMLLGFAAGLAGYTLGFEAIARGGVRQGIPAPVFFLFGTVGLLAAIGDLRMIRSGGLRGAPRLIRHLWRMCFALWIGAASFFLVPARVPEPIRDPVLRTIPVLVPIVAMLYWLWRMRTRWAIKEQTS